MKFQKLLCLMLTAVLCLTCLAGCKSGEEDFGVADSLVELEKNDQEDPDDPKSEPDEEQPSEETPKDDAPKDEDPADPDDTDPKEEDPKEEVPPSDQEPDQEPSQEPEPDDPAAPDEGDEELEPITKEESGTAITIMAQNLRHSGGDYGDPTYYDGATYNLYNRSRRFRESVKQNDPDVILASEGRPGWLRFFDTDPYIAQTYAYIFQKRGPDVPGGEEGTPVLYKRAKYDLVDKGHFWYSSTPNVMSSYPSTIAYNRVCSWVKLRDKNTGSVFYAYSVHLHIDGENSTFHIQSFRQFVHLTQKMEDADYAFFGGDFNVNYRQETYNDIMDWDHIIDLRDMAQAMEAEALCEVLPIQGSLAHGWLTNEPDTKKNENSRQIDYVMAKPNPRMAVDYYGFEYDMLSDSAAGVEPGYISDHYGLIVKVRIDTEVDYSRYQKQYEG